MKKKSASNSEESKSLKTFFLYAALVFSVILVAIVVKVFFVLQQSTFNGTSQYTVAVSKNDQLEELIAFNPSDNTIHILRVKDTQIPTASLGKFLAVIPDGTVDVPEDFEITTDATKMLSSIGFKYGFVKSDATLIDIVRLGFYSKNVPLGNRVIEEKRFSKESLEEEKEINRLVNDLFIDNKLSAENVSVQVINASGISGMGSRLERVLTNLGANVVSVTTSRTEEQVSKIEYFDKESYTLERLKNLLDLPVSQLEKETIANIVVTIGTDSISTTKF